MGLTLVVSLWLLKVFVGLRVDVVRNADGRRMPWLERLVCLLVVEEVLRPAPVT